MDKFIEEFNHLLKIKVYYLDNNLWQLNPIEDKTGTRIFKHSYTFMGDDEEFRKFLISLKAKDNKVDPPSLRKDTYKSIVQEIKDGSDQLIWVFSTDWNRVTAR